MRFDPIEARKEVDRKWVVVSSTSDQQAGEVFDTESEARNSAAKLSKIGIRVEGIEEQVTYQYVFTLGQVMGADTKEDRVAACAMLAVALAKLSAQMTENALGFYAEQVDSAVSPPSLQKKRKDGPKIVVPRLAIDRPIR